ncbi:MAG: pectinesterase family protein [Clostridiales bacterium]|nr:pectinesterase family protein [Clostridiales bacterium]
MQTVRYVSHNENGHFPNDFPTIAEAIKSVPVDNTEYITIFIRKGTYREKLVVDRPFICFLGEDANETIITYDDYALMMMEDGVKRGTFRTPTVFINTHDFIARNLTFQNSAGFGNKVGQALALYVDGDRIVFDDCKMLGSQDTLFTAPLPPTPHEPGGFTGPKEFAPRVNGRHYYHKCYIRGDVDFIFGSATAYFDNCEIFSQKNDDLPPAKHLEDQKIYGYVTAASTPKDQEYGYVFSNCQLTSDCPRKSVYLGRPWRNYAKTVFLNCELGDHIRDEGWCDWNKPEAHETILYAEYHNTGAGADGVARQKRASFSRQLTDEEALNYTKERVLRGKDGWIPSL